MFSSGFVRYIRGEFQLGMSPSSTSSAAESSAGFLVAPFVGLLRIIGMRGPRVIAGAFALVLFVAIVATPAFLAHSQPPPLPEGAGDRAMQTTRHLRDFTTGGAMCPTPQPEINTTLLTKEFAFHGHPVYSAFYAALRSYKLREGTLSPRPARGKHQWPLFVITRQNFALSSSAIADIQKDIEVAHASAKVPGTPLINFVEGVYNSIAGSKAMQVITKRQLALRDGCSFESIGLQPTTFVTFDSGECGLLKAGMAKNKLYIIKPSTGSKGQGIQVVRGTTETMRILHEKVCIVKTTPTVVIQEYLLDPLLIKGAKFDLRAYMLIGSTRPFTVFVRPGYVRRSLTPFDPRATQLKAHLTNTHVQQTLRGYDGGEHVWSMERFRAYIEGPQGGAPKGWVDGVLVSHMARVGRMLFESARDTLQRRRGAFHLIGLDFMVDRHFGIHFIEANSAPGMGYQAPWKAQLSRMLSRDMFGLVHSLQARPSSMVHLKEGDVASGFTLVYSERLDMCAARGEVPPAVAADASSRKYNVCAEFGAPMGIGPDTPGVIFSSGAVLDASMMAGEEDGDDEEGGGGGGGTDTDSSGADSSSGSEEAAAALEAQVEAR